MSWRDGRDSCTCSCTLTGLPAQIPTELRRGSANKTQTVILEVPTCLIHTFLQSPRHEERAPAPSTLFIITYILLYYIIHSYIATLYYVACFLPVLGVLGRYLYYIYLYIYMYIYLIMTILLLYTHAYTFIYIYTYIYINVTLLYIWSFTLIASTGVHIRMRTCVPIYLHYTLATCDTLRTGHTCIHARAREHTHTHT